MCLTQDDPASQLWRTLAGDHAAQWEKYHDEIWESLKALWSVWVPSQLVNFAFVPRHFRVPWGAAFDTTVLLTAPPSADN